MRKRKNVFPFLLAFLVLLVVAWFIRTQFPSPGTKSPETSESVRAHAGPPDIYPDPARTPGATNPAITQENIRETICNPRWSTKSIRPEASYTNRLKIEQIGEYRYADSRLRDYEEDHFIPLELGGAPRNPKNLWPEPHSQSKMSDPFENKLKRQVCKGLMKLAKARAAIRLFKNTQG